MADIKVTIKDSQLTRVVDGIAGQCGYQENIPDPKDFGKQIPNPETKAHFARKAMVEWVKDNVRAYEIRLAQEAAGKTAVDGTKDLDIT